MNLNSETLTIYSTRDYDLFKFYPSNRPAEHWPKIAQSIEQHDLTPFNPVIVNDQYFIVDGQNRFMACKNLKKPIWYVVSKNVSDKDIALLNASQRNWTLGDYLNFYINHGYEDYQRIQATLNETNLKLAWIIGSIWQSRSAKGNTSTYFKKGAYKFPEEAMKKCRAVSSVLFVIENVVDQKELRNTGSLVAAISSLVSSGVSPSELISCVKKNFFLFKAQADQVHYKVNLEEIYNYRKREKVSFKYK